jgi:hypothetical protein
MLLVSQNLIMGYFPQFLAEIICEGPEKLSTLKIMSYAKSDICCNPDLSQAI